MSINNMSLVDSLVDSVEVKSLTQAGKTNLMKTIKESEKREAILKKRFEMELESFKRLKENRIKEILDFEDKKKAKPMTPSGPIKPLTGMSFTEQLAMLKLKEEERNERNNNKNKSSSNSKHNSKNNSPSHSRSTSPKRRNNKNDDIKEILPPPSSSSSSLVNKKNKKSKNNNKKKLIKLYTDDKLEMEIGSQIHSHYLDKNEKQLKKYASEMPSTMMNSIISFVSTSVGKKKAVSIHDYNDPYQPSSYNNKLDSIIRKESKSINILKKSLPISQPLPSTVEKEIAEALVKDTENVVTTIVQDGIEKAHDGMKIMMIDANQYQKDKLDNDHMLEIRRKAVDRVRHHVIKARHDSKLQKQQEDYEREERDAKRKLKSIAFQERVKRDEEREAILKQIAEEKRLKEEELLKTNRNRQQIVFSRAKTPSLASQNKTLTLMDKTSNLGLINHPTMDYDVDYKHHNTSVYIGKSVDKFEYHHIINDESQFIGPDEFTNSVTEGDYVWSLSMNPDGTLASSQVLKAPDINKLEAKAEKQKNDKLIKYKTDGWYSSGDHNRATYFQAIKGLETMNNNPESPSRSRAVSPSKRHMSSAARSRLDDLIEESQLEELPKDSEQLVTDMVLNIKSRANPNKPQKLSITETKLVYSPFAKAFRLNKMSSQERMKMKENASITKKTKKPNKTTKRRKLVARGTIASINPMNNMSIMSDDYSTSIAGDYSTQEGSSVGFLLGESIGDTLSLSDSIANESLDNGSLDNESIANGSIASIDI